jgi:Lectin C-type domain
LELKITVSQATYEEARKKCCSYGTSLLSIKTAAKRKCISKLTKDYPDIAGEFWTSGTDGECDGNYRWCSVDRAFLKKEVLWAPNHPSKNKGQCVSVKTHPAAPNNTLQSASCDVKKRFICEVCANFVIFVSHPKEKFSTSIIFMFNVLLKALRNKRKILILEKTFLKRFANLVQLWKRSKKSVSRCWNLQMV